MEKVPRKQNELTRSVRYDDIGLDAQGAGAGETPDPHARLSVVVVPVVFRPYREDVRPALAIDDGVAGAREALAHGLTEPPSAESEARGVPPAKRAQTRHSGHAARALGADQRGEIGAAHGASVFVNDDLGVHRARVPRSCAVLALVRAGAWILRGAVAKETLLGDVALRTLRCRRPGRGRYRLR